MNRFAKTFRVLASLCVLLNMASLFLPAVKRVQDNYSDLVWTQVDYIQGMLARLIPSLERGEVAVTNNQALWVFCFMFLPAVVSLAAGIWGIVGSQVQKTSSILVMVSLLLYAGMAATIDNLWLETATGQAYCRGPAYVMLLSLSGLGTLFSIAALIATPRKVKVVSNEILQLKDAEEQADVKYHILDAEGQGRDGMEVSANTMQSEPAHGVLVGVTGVYAGAQISIVDGQEILLGRGRNNHLVFEGQDDISRGHCKIRWDEAHQKYVINDYSANGSFIMGEENCLPQNLDILLDPGMTIMLANENNTFYLK